MKKKIMKKFRLQGKPKVCTNAIQCDKKKFLQPCLITYFLELVRLSLFY